MAHEKLKELNDTFARRETEKMPLPGPPPRQANGHSR